MQLWITELVLGEHFKNPLDTGLNVLLPVFKTGVGVGGVSIGPVICYKPRPIYGILLIYSFNLFIEMNK
jgi:hypothetical protein